MEFQKHTPAYGEFFKENIRMQAHQESLVLNLGLRYIQANTVILKIYWMWVV